MQLALIALAAFVLMGQSKPAPTPPPQQTQTPPVKEGQSTGQVVADVIGAAIDLFNQFMNSQPKK